MKPRKAPPAKFDDNPPLTAARIRKLRPAREVLPDLVAAHEKRKAGRPKLDRPKVLLTLRVDPDVVDTFKGTGEGWQARMNDALAKGAQRIKAA